MKPLQYLPFICLFGFLSMGISGCEESKDIQNWVENTAKLKLAAEDQLPNVPYRKTQHKAFKSYFSELNQMALGLRNDEKLKGRFNDAATKGDINAICKKIFIVRSRWNSLMANCTKNRFFLCAEEVRAYPDLFLGLRSALRVDLQKKFDQAQNCQAVSR